MTTSNSTRERRDWTLLIFLIPIGIIFMLVAGQVAIRLVPTWSLNAGMQSNLDPNNLPMQQSGPIQPVLPAILTPLGWLDTFLTPDSDTGDDIVFPPIIIFHPTITPVVTTPPPTRTTTVTATTTVVVTPSSITPTPTSPTVVVTPPSPTRTPKPTNSPTSTPITPTSTPITPVPVISTLPTSATQVPAPTDIVGTPDPQIYKLADGTYVVLDLGSSPIQVNGSDPDYDLVYYEMEFSILGIPSGSVYMDQVIIGITNDPTGNTFYTVFNWGGDGVPDMNSNVGDIALLAGGEVDNQPIQVSDLYGTDPNQTGIAIDVDNAPSNPPPVPTGYQYVVIFAPATGSGEPADINAIEVLP